MARAKQSLRERVKEWVAKARKRVRELAERRKELPAGSKRRRKKARQLRAKRRELEKLKRRLKRIEERRKERRARPDWRACEPVLGRLGERVVKKAAEFGLVPTSTTGGRHSSTSWHYRSKAIDFGVDWSTGVTASQRTARLIAFQRWLDSEFGSRAYEVFGPDSHYIKNGRRYGGAFPGHGDHVHFAHP